jgi:hypothetical protein
MGGLIAFLNLEALLVSSAYRLLCKRKSTYPKMESEIILE